ncbi:uncharacterized protein LOC144108545 [Amblyomma americanum]
MTIYSSQKSLTALQDTLNTDLNNVYSWCTDNKLQINPLKTTFVLFHNPQTSISSPITVSLNTYVIPTSDTVKFLGITLDKHLKFNSHANSLIKKVSLGIRIIIKTRAFFHPHIIRSLYHAYINSHLSYCLSSWGNTYAIHLKPPLRLQNQAIKLMAFSSFRCHSLPIYQRLNILPIQQLSSVSGCFLYCLTCRSLCVDPWEKHWLLICDYGDDEVLICDANEDQDGDLIGRSAWKKAFLGPADSYQVMT